MNNKYKAPSIISEKDLNKYNKEQLKGMLNALETVTLLSNTGKYLKSISRIRKYLIDNNIVTLQNVKDQFYAELASDNTLCMSLEQYIREYYIPCYDAELNFIGYEVKTLWI